MLKSTLASGSPPAEKSDVDGPAEASVAVAVPPHSVLDSPASADVALAPPAHDTPGGQGDAIIDEVIAEVVADPEAIGLLLHGSRASGTADVHSNYDFACQITDDAFERRTMRDTTVERRFRTGFPAVEVAYEGIDSFRRAARAGGSRGATFALATVLVDKTGEIEPLIRALVAAGEPDRDAVADHYDRYLHGFAHSLKAWSRGDDLGARAHAAQSGLSLVAALFALEGKSAPYLDQLSMRLAELDEPQGWRPGFLPGALHRLFYSPDAPFQQMLERRVGRLMESRGVLHGWRHDLDRLRVVSYDKL
jgi:hypothetical protein